MDVNEKEDIDRLVEFFEEKEDSLDGLINNVRHYLAWQNLGLILCRQVILHSNSRSRISLLWRMLRLGFLTALRLNGQRCSQRMLGRLIRSRASSYRISPERRRKVKVEGALS